MTIEHGYCHCGCGEKTKIAPYNHKREGWVKGEPHKYLSGHNLKREASKKSHAQEAALRYRS